MRSTSTTAAALLLAAGLGLSACSSGDRAQDDSSSAAPSSSAPASASAPSSSAQGGSGSGDIDPAAIAALALTAADFPAPYTFTALPPGALKQGGAAISGALAGAKFDPPECGDAAAPTAGVDLSQAGAAIGADKGTGATIAELVTPSTTAVPDYAAQAAACKTFTFTLGSSVGSARGQASVELLDTPDVEADRVQAARTTVDISIAGQKQTITTTVYAAELRGVVVVVTGTAPAGATTDTSVLAHVLAAGVAKVASA